MLIALLTKDIQIFNTYQCHIIGRFSCLVSSCSVVHPVPPGHLEQEDDEDEAEEDVEPGEGEADVDDLPAHPVRHSRRGNQVLEAPGLLQQGHQGYTTPAHDLPSPDSPSPPPLCCWRMPPPCPPQLHWTAPAPSSLLCAWVLLLIQVYFSSLVDDCIFHPGLQGFLFSPLLHSTWQIVMSMYALHTMQGKARLNWVGSMKFRSVYRVSWMQLSSALQHCNIYVKGNLLFTMYCRTALSFAVYTVHYHDL